MTTQRDAFDGAHVKAELNQYWYSDRTRHALVREMADHATRCAFLSTPSLFFALRDAAHDDDDDTNKKSSAADTDNDADSDDVLRRRRLRALWEASYLFEWDAQWSTCARVVRYDYHAPEQIPVQHLGAFDYVVADPPFITDDVWSAYVTTARLLLPPCGGGGKVLFTSVLENHTMLERQMNEALFIAAYWPAVRGLTYQYVCFTNYETTQLRTRNDELPAPDSDAEARVLASIAMANDLRSAEKGFALQLASRDRTGEVALPTHNAHKSNKCDAADEASTTTTAAATSSGADAAVDWQRVPLTQMPWGYIPAHLQQYAESADNEAGNGDVGGGGVDERGGAGHVRACYACAHALRARLDAFKGGIDTLQRTLTRELLLRQRLAKLRTRDDDAAAQGQEPQQQPQPQPQPHTSPAEAEAQRIADELASVREARAQQLRCLSDEATRIGADEEQLALLRAAAAEAAAAETATTTTAEEAAADVCGGDDSCTAHANNDAGGVASAGADVVCTYMHVMRDCIAAYAAVEMRKAALQELAADATRKYKSPLFHRMQELLQLMKRLKKAEAARSG